MVFQRQRNLVEKMYCAQWQHFHLYKYQDVYRRYFTEILHGLKRQLNFYEFSIYFSTFFHR